MGGDVSSKHCQFTLTLNNNQELLYVTDLSSNGLLVNDERLGKGSNTILRSGDKIDFAKTGGSYIFRYSFDIESETPELVRKNIL